MTIDQAVACLQQEQQQRIPSRFPCRAIMVRNIAEYCELLSKLKKCLAIDVVPSAELFSSADVMPRYEALSEPALRERWVILAGVSEYLRLFAASEANTQRFAKLWSHQASGDSTGRVIIPLWGCEAQWHDHSLHLCEDIRQNDFYLDCVDDESPEQEMRVLVFSGEFEQYVTRLSSQHGQIITGLQEWYESWMSPAPETTEQVLLTHRIGSIQPSTGRVTIRLIRNAFTFVRENLKDGQILAEDDCPQEALTLLFDHAINGESIDGAILAALNAKAFSSLDEMGKWNIMQLGQKQLVALWYRLHPDESYLCHCFQAADDVADVCEHVLHDIFSLRPHHPDWVTESQQLAMVMRLDKDERYFEKLDAIPDYEERIRFLCGTSKEERVYLLRTAGRWMREDESQAMMCDALKQAFPALFAYLEHAGQDEALNRYLSLYKLHKLKNSLPDDESLYFSGIQTETYAPRFAALSSAQDEDCVVLWVDALGVEWLALLLWSLRKSCEGIILETSVTQATLPTETEFNKQWDQMEVPHRKLNSLDKLAHRGVIDDPDYYACIIDQFSFVSGLTETVNRLLGEYHRVIVTGDHGTSRLAARFFHKRDGVPVPPGATACSHGRYCRIGDTSAVSDTNLKAVKASEDQTYLVFTNYDHFTQSGYAAGAEDENAIFGEVHGGATPEESLVPVIVIDSLKEKPLTAKWDKDAVKIAARKATAVVRFNRPIDQFVAKINEVEGLCSPTANRKVWNVLFTGIKPGVYTVSAVANGFLVVLSPLTVLSAIGGKGDLP